jgi:AcrR family transcriptional regulator
MPKVIDKEQYREVLLTKSFALFADRGYASITMRQLAQALEVSTGTLYHYFANKQEIFEQTMLLRLSRSLGLFQQLEAIDSRSEKIQFVFNYLGRTESEFFQELMLYVEFFQYHQSQGGTNILPQVYDRIQLEIVHLLQISDPDAVQLVIGAIDGLLLARIYGRKPNWERQGKILGQLFDLDSGLGFLVLSQVDAGGLAPQ